MDMEDLRGTPKRVVRRVAWVGLWCNLGLSILKVVTGVLANSQAVVADGVHSLSDLVTDLAVIIGVRFWSAPPDESHPHGHARIETLVTVSIGLILALVAVGLCYEALATVRSPEVAVPGWAAFFAALVSIVLKEWLFRWTAAKGREVSSPALEANAWHHRSDALSSVPAAVAVAVGAFYPEWAFIDRVGAVIVSLMILQAAWKITRPALDQLVDRGAPEEQVRRITEIAISTRGVLEVHKVRSRYLGQGLQVDLHVLVDPDITVREGHAISELVRVRLLELCRNVHDVVVHLEPYVQEEILDPDA